MSSRAEGDWLRLFLGEERAKEHSSWQSVDAWDCSVPIKSPDSRRTAQNLNQESCKKMEGAQGLAMHHGRFSHVASASLNWICVRHCRGDEKAAIELVRRCEPLMRRKAGLDQR
jgi:hypothetical protein